MTMQVYLIHAHDDEGENLDWFVSAETVEQAVALWREHLANDWMDPEDAAGKEPETIAVAPQPAEQPTVHAWNDLFVPGRSVARQPISPRKKDPA
jgi:hypothetical protein